MFCTPGNDNAILHVTCKCELMCVFLLFFYENQPQALFDLFCYCQCVSMLLAVRPSLRKGGSDRVGGGAGGGGAGVLRE